MLKWCLEEAKANNLKPQDYMGGFILDEMKIQVSSDHYDLHIILNYGFKLVRT